MKNNEIKDDLPDFLKDLKDKGDGFKIPEGYFDHLEDAVFTRLKAAGDLNHPSIKVLRRPGLFTLFIRPKAALAYAAAMAMILAAIWFIRQPSSTVQSPTMVSTELTEEDLESYVLENAHEFDPEQLASLTTCEIPEPLEEITPDQTKQNSPASEDIHPDDLDKILDEMTDEELEQIL